MSPTMTYPQWFKSRLSVEIAVAVFVLVAGIGIGVLVERRRRQGQHAGGGRLGSLARREV